MYKRQGVDDRDGVGFGEGVRGLVDRCRRERGVEQGDRAAVSYTHLRAHETVLDLVCRLLLEKKKLMAVQSTSRPLI